eukprot:TRINITY_DN4602_c0_g1_i1.p1 TRINITY_DN4602_c0_g1~~TRINITY_DN4602_c0_g1_i1.p1  ORF type:complete len:203 (-),score=40.03 TRINITY_DN4602_c0_g1_i1:267-875(-)
MSRRTLFVGGLSAHTKTQDVAHAFKKFGRLLRCDIPTPGGRSKGFAFVEFEDERDAEEAFNGMRNKKICGREVSLQFAKRSPSSAWRYRNNEDRRERRRRRDSSSRSRSRSRSSSSRSRSRSRSSSSSRSRSPQRRHSAARQPRSHSRSPIRSSRTSSTTGRKLSPSEDSEKVSEQRNENHVDKEKENGGGNVDNIKQEESN